MNENIPVGMGTGVGVGALLTWIMKPWIEKRIASYFGRIQQAHGIVGVAAIRYRELQLSEFYCPLYAYAKGMQRIYKLWMDHKLTHINEPTKKLFREQNECMLNIIRTKAHLIDNSEFPDEMTQFITSVTIWNLYTSQQDGLPDEVANLPEAAYPFKFQEYIYTKTEELKEDLERLYKDYGVKPKSKKT